jgi:hypothetical protein
MELIMSFIQRSDIADLSRRIVAALVGTNDEVSDTALSQVVGETIAPNSYALKAAFRDLQRADPPIHFRRIRRVGWKRMHDPDLVVHSEADLKKIARGARRGRKRLGDVRFSALNNQDQLHAARNNTRFAAIEDAATTVKSRMPSRLPDLSDVIARIKGEQVT